MSTSTPISRDLAVKYGREAVRIIEAGQYTNPSGRVVQIAEMISSSTAGTRSYPPSQPLPEFDPGTYKTDIRIENETTLAAVCNLNADGYYPVALNFASATSPGGGFLDGARAQEEYLARSSGLYACLRDNPMYEFHRARRDALYTNYVVYSPGVPVFRADDGSLLEQPYTAAIITSPAVNAEHVRPERLKEIAPAMWARILKVLSAGLAHGHEAIVLGAWGCGAFGNDGYEIAGLFRKALAENFTGAYRRVTFAIVDWSPEKQFIRPFQTTFSTWAG
jgi:uncharacterized protein (TIGR02452 family)